MQQSKRGCIGVLLAFLFGVTAGGAGIFYLVGGFGPPIIHRPPRLLVIGEVGENATGTAPCPTAPGNPSALVAELHGPQSFLSGLFPCGSQPWNTLATGSPVDATGGYQFPGYEGDPPPTATGSYCVAIRRAGQVIASLGPVNLAQDPMASMTLSRLCVAAVVPPGGPLTDPPPPADPLKDPPPPGGPESP